MPSTEHPPPPVAAAEGDAAATSVRDPVEDRRRDAIGAVGSDDPGAVRVTGHDGAFEVRDFLTRNRIAYGFEPADGPVRIGTADGAHLVRPGLRELAAAVGCHVAAGRDHYDVVVVGAGPAGLAAAVYGAAEGLTVLVVEAFAAGGQAGTTSLIENCPGFTDGISGRELAERTRLQALRLGAEVVLASTVVDARTTDDGHRSVVLDDGSRISAGAVVCHTAGAESESHKLNCNGAPVAAPHLSNCNSQQSGSSDEQPKQQGWDHQSGLQLHQAPEPSGWDVDSESEDGAAWTVGGNNKCNWETHNQQDNEASSVPRCAWQPNQFQGNNAKGTGFFTPIILQKPQQQQCMHNNHQYSPDPLARTPFNSTKDHTERDQRMPIRVGGWNPDTFQGQKAPYHVGGWNPDRYQGTGAAAYSDADVSTVEKQPQQPSAVQDDSLKSLLSFAFPQAPSLHKTSEATRPALVHARAEQPDSDLNDSLGRMHIQRPTSSSASGRQKQELGAHSEIPCGATPLPSQKASQMQSEQHEGWSHSCISQSRPERSAASPGGFGSHTSHARSSERICAQSIHHSLSSITEKELLHNSGAQLATNSSANNDHNGQDRQHSPSRQHCQDSGQLEGAVPLGVGSEANDADGVQPEEDNAKGCDSDGDDAKGVDPGEDDVGEVSSDIDDAMGGDSEGVAPGYTAQVGEGRVTCSS